MISIERARELLVSKRDQISGFRRYEEVNPEFTKWHRDTRVAIRKVFGKSHEAEFASVRYSLTAYTSSTPEIEFTRAYHRGLEIARSMLNSMIEELDTFGIVDDPAPSLDVDSRLRSICSRFHLIARQLRARHANRPTIDVSDEYDVQDLLHAILHLHFDDVRKEEWTPSYAGGHARCDFLLKNERILIEVKRTRQNLSDRELGDQLIIDISRYKSHPDCDRLFCFVYDPEARIGNPRGLEVDLTRKHDSLDVEVVVRPK